MAVKNYKRKIAIVHAIQYDGTKESAEEIERFVDKKFPSRNLVRVEKNKDKTTLYLIAGCVRNMKIIHVFMLDWVVLEGDYLQVYMEHEFCKLFESTGNYKLP